MAAILQVTTKHYGSTKEWPILQDWRREGGRQGEVSKKSMYWEKDITSKGMGMSHGHLPPLEILTHALPHLANYWQEQNSGTTGSAWSRGCREDIALTRGRAGDELLPGQSNEDGRVTNEEEEHAKGKWKIHRWDTSVVLKLQML